jgi:hypothetical protein
VLKAAGEWRQARDGGPHHRDGIRAFRRDDHVVISAPGKKD